MGVEGLYPYARGCEKTISFEVIPPNERETHNWRYIIVDGTCWLWNWMKGNFYLDFIAARQKASTFVNWFESCGFKLIVFIDANVTTDKLDTWLSRRAMRAPNLIHFNTRLKKAFGSHFFDNSNWFSPSGLYFFVGQMFESLGCKVVYAHIDCDREIVGYLSLFPNDRIYAVCGRDTDFLIFDVPIYIDLTSVKYNRYIQQLSCTGFEHADFLRKLRLKQAYLPRLASLMGCDVIGRSPGHIQAINFKVRGFGFSSEIDSIARYLRQLDYSSMHTDDDSSNESNNSNSDKRKIKISAPLRHRFAVGEFFYTPVIPPDMVAHPWLITLLFNNITAYIDSIQMEKPKKDDIVAIQGRAIALRHSIIMDSNFDDTLSFHGLEQSSAVFCRTLRRWLYQFIFDIDCANDDCRCLTEHYFVKSIREIICFPDLKHTHHPNAMKATWRKGVILDGIQNKSNWIRPSNAIDETEEKCADNTAPHTDNNCDNPLLGMQSYKYVKQCLQRNADQKMNTSIVVPPALMLDDILYLYNYLVPSPTVATPTQTADLNSKANDTPKNEKSKPNDTESKSNETESKTTENEPNAPSDIAVSGPTNEVKVETSENLQNSSTKLSKKQKKKHRNRRKSKMKANHKQMATDLKVKQALAAENSSATSPNNSKNGKNNNGKNRLIPKMMARHRMHTYALKYQFKYRHLLTNIHSKAMSKYAAKIQSLDMHFRSVILHIYELIYVFLLLQCQQQWYPSLITHFIHFMAKSTADSNKDEKSHPSIDDKCQQLFDSIPSMLLRKKHSMPNQPSKPATIDSNETKTDVSMTTDECRLNDSSDESLFLRMDELVGNAVLTSSSMNGASQKQLWLQQWKDLMRWRSAVETRFGSNNEYIRRTRVTVPFVWEVFDSKLFHWICTNFEYSARLISAYSQMSDKLD